MRFVVRVMKLRKDKQPTVNNIWVRSFSRMLNSDFTKIQETKTKKWNLKRHYFKVFKIFNVFDSVFLNVGSLENKS